MSINWDAVAGIATAALVATGAGAIYFAYRQIENERAYRRIDNLEAQIDRFDREPIAGHRKKLAEARLDASRTRLRILDVDDPPTSAYEVLNFFEHIAFLVEKGHLNIYDVWHSFGYWARATYYDFRSLIEYEQREDPSTYCDFLKLDARLRKIDIEETGAENTWLPDELVNYYLSEIEEVKKPRRRRAARNSARKKSELHGAVSPACDGDGHPARLEREAESERNRP